MGVNIFNTGLVDFLYDIDILKKMNTTQKLICVYIYYYLWECENYNNVDNMTISEFSEKIMVDDICIRRNLEDLKKKEVIDFSLNGSNEISKIYILKNYD
jgi:hypothetical protein